MADFGKGWGQRSKYDDAPEGGFGGYTGGYKGGGYQGRGGGKGKGNSDKVCRDFSATGWCARGDNCHFKHPQTFNQGKGGQQQQRQQHWQPPRSAYDDEDDGGEGGDGYNGNGGGGGMWGGGGGGGDDKDDDGAMDEIFAAMDAMGVGVRFFCVCGGGVVVEELCQSCLGVRGNVTQRGPAH